MAYKDPAAEKAYNATRQRTNRTASRQAHAHQCEHEGGCTTITTVRWVRRKGYTPNRFCQRHVGVQPVQIVDDDTGQLVQMPAIEAASRRRSFRSRRVTTPAKTHRTRRQKGWRRGPSSKPLVNATELAEQMRSPAMRLAGRLGVIWRQGALTPPLTRLTYRGRGVRRSGRERKEWLPADPYELLATVAVVRKAKDQGSGFVAIGRKIGKSHGWGCHKDTHGNVTMCPMASKVYRFSQVLDQRLPDWRTITKK